MSGSKADRENERRLSILGDLMKEPANKECADCSSKGPRWASWSLGIFLCINCAGIHRSLGTHISKVKSATLDKWTEEQVESMQRMGNARAKEIYQANVPAHYSIPTEGASAHTLENWIKAKYERKEFMLRGQRNTPSSSPAPSPSKERRDRDSEDRAKRRAEREKRRADREKRREQEERERIRTPPPPTPVTERVSAPQVAQTPAPTPKSADLNELLGFGSGAPTPSSPSPSPSTQTASPKVDKASIMSLYATPMQPSHGMQTSMQPILTTNHMRIPPNYNISLTPSPYGATTVPYMVAPTPTYTTTPYAMGAYPSYGQTTMYASPVTVPGVGYGQPQVRLN